MELTQKYLDRSLEKQNKLWDQRFNHLESKVVTKDYLDGRLGNFATKDDLDNKLTNFATKDDLDNKLTNFATKDDLREALATQTKHLENYTNDVTQGIIEAMDFRFNKVDQRLNNLELDMGQVKTILRIPQNAHK